MLTNQQEVLGLSFLFKKSELIVDFGFHLPCMVFL
jgi:hypothetical protein